MMTIEEKGKSSVTQCVPTNGVGILSCTAMGIYLLNVPVILPRDEGSVTVLALGSPLMSLYVFCSHLCHVHDHSDLLSFPT